MVTVLWIFMGINLISGAFTAKNLSKLAKLSSAYSYYGITGPKTSSATALPAHRAPPPLDMLAAKPFDYRMT